MVLDYVVPCHLGQGESSLSFSTDDPAAQIHNLTWKMSSRNGHQRACRPAGSGWLTK